MPRESAHRRASAAPSNATSLAHAQRRWTWHAPSHGTQRSPRKLVAWLRVLAMLVALAALVGAARRHMYVETGARTRPATLAAHLRGKHVLVVQTDSRMWRVWARAPLAFTNATFGPSVLDVSGWAAERGYAYLHVTSPRKCVSPAGKRMVLYWCKVPAILYALRVCRAHALDAVVYVDTDVFARQGELGVDAVLAQAPGAHLIVTPAAYNSSWARWLRVKTNKKHPLYTRGPVNSGSLLVRCTAEGEALVHKWWFNLTSQPTPFERRMLRSSDQATTIIAAELDAAGPSDVLPPLVKGYAMRMPLPDVIARFKLDEGGDGALLPELMLAPSSAKRKAAYLALKHAFCAGGRAPAALRALLNATGAGGWTSRVVHARCEFSAGASTLVKWPGDQDRLNWLYESSAPSLVAAADEPCLACAPELGETAVLTHAWGQMKLTEARRASERARARAGSGDAAAWERVGAWDALRSQVALLRVDDGAAVDGMLEAMGGDGGERFFLPAGAW